MTSMTRPQPRPALPKPGPPATRTDRLLPLAGTRSWPDHLARLGPTPARWGDSTAGNPDLATSLNLAGLLGRGGAGFPTGRKVAAVTAAVKRSRRPGVVVANCCEGDPTSLKDQVLVHHSPHLVIDGAIAAAAAVGADRVVLAAHQGSAAEQTLRWAIAERPAGTISPVARDEVVGRSPTLDRACLPVFGRPAMAVIGIPDRYIASEATSLVRFLNTGDARPAGKLTPIWESGVGGRPTLVDNAETLAHLALLARFGPQWFAGVGTAAEPGTCLVTIGGAVSRPGVVEVPNGAPLREVLACAGASPIGWALLGGVSGRWIDFAAYADIGYSTAALAAAGLARGVGSIVVLPPGGCILTETARILAFQAHAGARQCGPCMFGLPAIAADMADLGAGDRAALNRLQRRLPVINGRGGCGHPDGAVTLAASALTAMTVQQPGHLAQHLNTGGCHAPPPVVPLGPALSTTDKTGGGRP